ncbi:3-hydroxyacyl-CoA dehydrogenase, C-terminal domain-containing protein 3 [Advenella kashmirensis WT001]|uniref:3-hydroxyacyl-CoA dehydrogenase, C-terminal domain-containing protein 3 n=1 Tax=Advenella kashmirensis (strain DSM 17095 / LMG 22695 / WT001) TaxID=1036672 RepID=I3UA83_ADVKW|nr:3-hydroxyacyl-CoA dehydrogenase NAD-binding domain-containing protein [Advenella kashmirensis]AFK61921.1 3-hydroxyacyl-CoA dehydrogenase, C-terminal domain-containing protein 3 [Advenella kashmirensis WT001]
MDNRNIKTIAIIGAGTIGSSWAALFLAHGYHVVVSDPAPDVEANTRTLIDSAWQTLRELGKVKNESFLHNLRFEADLHKALENVDFVQENAPEREDFKISLFAKMDALLPEHVIISSSSSGLLVSRMQSQCRYPQRCVLGHPFNPPHVIPLVEVVGGEQTSEDTIARTLAFYRAVGKHPIRLNKEIAGHIANRLQAAVWREVMHLVNENVASVQDIDAAMSKGPGLRWAIFGPQMVFDLAGGRAGLAHLIDHLQPAIESWMDDLGNPRMTPELRARMVQARNRPGR